MISFLHCKHSSEEVETYKDGKRPFNSIKDLNINTFLDLCKHYNASLFNKAVEQLNTAVFNCQLRPILLCEFVQRMWIHRKITVEDLWKTVFLYLQSPKLKSLIWIKLRLLLLHSVMLLTEYV